MRKTFFFFWSCILILSLPAFSQDKDLMRKYEAGLDTLFTKVFNEPTDNERYNANEQAIALLAEALAEHKAFDWEWNLLKGRLSILASKDKRIKVFTWAIVRDNGEYECFGLMQVEDEKNREYDVITLVDKSSTIINPEESVLAANNWYGVVYSDLITTKYEDKIYYTLLGWSGNNQIYQRKVIETLSFKPFSTDPIFGQKIFHRIHLRKNVDKDRRRVIFEYSKKGNIMLAYGNQHYVESKRIKTSRTAPAKIEETVFKVSMIVFDELEAPIEGMAELPQYNLPSGVVSGYLFEKNKWVFKKDLTLRQKKNKILDNLNQYKKTRPPYEVPRNYE